MKYAFALLLFITSCIQAWSTEPGPCTDNDWWEVENDILWTIQTDWGAKDCFQEQYGNGQDATRGVIRCNPGLKGMEGEVYKDMKDKQKAHVRCGARVCNFLKSKGYERGC